MAIPLELRSGTALLCIGLMLTRLFICSPASWASEVSRTPFSQPDAQFYQSRDIDPEYKAGESRAAAPISKATEKPFQATGVVSDAPVAGEVPRTLFSQTDMQLYQSLNIDQQFKIAGLIALGPVPESGKSPFQVANEDATVKNLSGVDGVVPPDMTVAAAIAVTEEDPFEVENEKAQNTKEAMKSILGVVLLVVLIAMLVALSSGDFLDLSGGKVTHIPSQ